ncbi:substrate-binding domain-containing protein [Phycicoccus sp. M110.8]|uniref:LacI family DNA-binding transcriptional regulator n=1 Tax=Phycicoccus sp. M110.8 TaxID=3075433 RepID=UPI0028FD2FAB|nr:substrate-binding domain-containing protein [Phycicoccus sp. M110.8]MDU0315236.1 substrate-binding domain-containing protein [Phycicoccus sp. M110.8]
MATRATRPGDRVTIVDVAAAAGVSRQTVSNALNKPHLLAAETLAKVHAAIDELGFAPNVAAQQLRRRRASAYGFEVNPSGAGRMGHILDGFLVEMTVAAPGHAAHLVTFAPDLDALIEGYDRLLGTGLVDGFVLGDTRRGDPRPDWLLGQDVPFVTFGRIWDRPDLGGWVDVDGRAGMRIGVEHLLSQGYEHVAWLGWPEGSPVGEDRRAGWLDALVASGHDDDASLTAEAVQDVAEATAAAERLLHGMGGRGAILCASDLLALGAVRAIAAQDLRLGTDVGVVGFDDSDVAEALSLTSLRQPLRAAAEAAWGILQPAATNPGATDGAATPPAAGRADRTALLPPTLTIRASSTRDPSGTPTGRPTRRSST